ncbi:MAG: carboxypeptidase-like regulatory domain-containing protein [Terriglobales bacterium]|jgi:hypothetical protein
MKRILPIAILLGMFGFAFAATCPDAPPMDLRGTRGAILNPNGAPVVSAKIKLYSAHQVSPNTYRKSTEKAIVTAMTDNQGAFDLSTVQAGVYFLTLTQKNAPERSALVRIPAKNSAMLPKQKEIWLKLSQDECVGMMVYVPNQ